MGYKQKQENRINFVYRIYLSKKKFNLHAMVFKVKFHQKISLNGDFDREKFYCITNLVYFPVRDIIPITFLGQIPTIPLILSTFKKRKYNKILHTSTNQFNIQLMSHIKPKNDLFFIIIRTNEYIFDWITILRNIFKKTITLPKPNADVSSPVFPKDL